VPNAPNNLTASAASATSINLSWTDNSNNETGFKLERSPTGTGNTWSQIPNASTVITGTTYSNTGLTANTVYYYRVRATSANGDSTYSNIANATTLTTAPAAPSGLTAAATSSSTISISWTDVANETGYYVERKTGPSGTYAVIRTLSANAAGIGDSGLAANTIYYYRVRAYNASGNSAYSNEASATTPSIVSIPAAPTGLVARRVATNRITLAWQDRSNNETAFYIYRSLNILGPFTTEIGTTGANITTYTDSTGLVSGRTYYYMVKARNNAGYSAGSNVASVVNSVALK